MNNFKIYLVGLLVLLLASSCQKNYSCTCETVGQSYKPSNTKIYYHLNKKQAKATCDAAEKTLTESYSQNCSNCKITAICKIEKE